MHPLILLVARSLLATLAATTPLAPEVVPEVDRRTSDEELWKVRSLLTQICTSLHISSIYERCQIAGS